VEKIANAIAYAQEKGLKIEEGMLYFPFKVVTGNRIPGVYCRSMGEELCIYPNGDIFPCGALKIKLGNIQDMDKVFKSESYGRIVHRVAGNIPACCGCEIEAFCAGGCAADAFAGQGGIFHAAGNCEIEKSIFQVLVRNYLLD
jgi:radical SAM protein with 4Fe4S-binding SPASM domain